MSTESHDLSKFVASAGVTGMVGPPMTRAERRAANEAYRVQEEARNARIDALFAEYELVDDVVVRDAVGDFYQLSVMKPDSRHDLMRRQHDAWWDCFGSEEGWPIGHECTHASRRTQGTYSCPVRDCHGGPVPPFTVVSRPPT